MAWAVPVVAVLMLGLTLAPAEIWQQPVNDVVYKGFDPNLIFVGGDGSDSVQVASDAIDLTAPAQSKPSVNLATTLLPKLATSVDVTILDNNRATEPFRIGFWSPWSASGVFLVFGPAPKTLMTVESITAGQLGTTLSGGHVADSTVLGPYRLDTSYHVSIVVDRTSGFMTFAVTAADGTNGTGSVTSRQSPAIFSNVQMSLSASASPGVGSSRAVLRNYSLTFPHERWWASKIADPKAQALLIGLSVAAFLLLVIAAASWYRGRAARGPTTPRARESLWLQVGRRKGLLVILGALGLYLVGNALLFPLGGHPFDMADEKLHAYISRAYGLADLYYLPNAVSLPKIWGGVPYVEMAFPYEPTFVYLSAGVGWFYSLLVAGGGTFNFDEGGLEYLIKAVNVLFGLADGALIYGVLRQIGATRRWSLIPAGLFLFNPAVWFSMSVWGQTHVISLFFVLAAVWLAEKHMPLWAWLALAAACLTRPQMVVFGLVLGIVFLRKFTWRENLTALSWTVILTFLALLPLTLATSPSLPVDVMLNNFHIQEAGGNGSALSPVSQGGYSIWPLVTYLAHGASGLQRTFTASSDVLVGSLTYQRLAQLLTLGAVLLVSAALLLRRRAALSSGAYLPLVALGIASFLMLVTGVVATHFLLALPFLLLCRRWMNNVAYVYVIAIWTITTLVPMYGEMGIVLSTQAYPLLAPENNPITESFIRLSTWDRFITVAVVANICAVVWLAVLTLRQTGTSAASPGPPAGLVVAAVTDSAVRPTRAKPARSRTWLKSIRARLSGSAIEHPRVGDIRYPRVLGLLVAASALVFAGVLYLTSYKNFYQDEWDFITGERSWNLSLIFMPHNEHWVTIPVLVWKVLFLLVGIRSHIPYEAALLFFHVAAVLLLFALVRRRSGDLPAFAAALTLLVLGTGGTNIVWAFQIGFVGSVAFGLLAMLLLDGNAPPSPGRLAGASAALLCSLMCSGIGLGFLAAVAAELFVDPRRRRHLLALVVPVVAYAAWFLAFSSGLRGSPGLTCPGCGPPAVGADFSNVSLSIAYFVGVAGFVAFGLVASLAGVFGSQGAGAVLLPVVAALIALRWHRQGRIESWQIGMIAGFAALFTLIGLVRIRFGAIDGADPHYVYVGAVFLLPLVADAIGGLPWRSYWRPALIGVFALTLFGNAAQLRDVAVSQTELMRTQQAELQVLEVFRGAPDMALQTSPDDLIMPQMVPARYYPAIDELGSPVPSASMDTLRQLPPQTVDQVMLNLFGGAMTIKADSQRSAEGLPCLGVNATAGSAMLLRVSDGQSVMLQSSRGGGASLFLGFLQAPPPGPIQEVQLLPATPEWLYVPDTGKPVVWQVLITTGDLGTIRVCGPFSLVAD